MNQITYAGKRLLTYSVSRHAHSAWELIYCTSGEGRLVFDSAALAYQAGDLVIIPPLTPHLNESEGGFTNIHLNFTDPQLPFREPVILHGDGNRFLLDAFQAAFYVFSSDPGHSSRAYEHDHYLFGERHRESDIFIFFLHVLPP